MSAHTLRDIATRGQVFTPAPIVERMLGLIRNKGRVLEPACGDGAFVARIPPHYPEVVAIEIDPAHCPAGALNADFFTYPEVEKFEIGRAHV
jgi:adenine-specific DNA-methyltransferase